MIHWAVESGHLNLLKAVGQEMPRVGSCRPLKDLHKHLWHERHSNTSLLIACKNRNSDILAYLLGARFKIENWECLLDAACQAGCVGSTRVLLNTFDKQRQVNPGPFIHSAAIYGHEDILIELVLHYLGTLDGLLPASALDNEILAAFDLPDSLSATETRKLDENKASLDENKASLDENKASLDFANDEGETALAAAVIAGKSIATNILLRLGASIEFASSCKKIKGASICLEHFEISPEDLLIGYVVQNGPVGLAGVLIDHCMSMDRSDHRIHGPNLLSFAIVSQRAEMVDELVRRGFSLQEDEFPWTRVFSIHPSPHPEALEFLMSNDVLREMMPDSDLDWTLLHHAVAEGVPITTIEALLRYGVEPKALDGIGDTAFELVELKVFVGQNALIKGYLLQYEVRDNKRPKLWNLCHDIFQDGEAIETSKDNLKPLDFYLGEELTLADQNYMRVLRKRLRSWQFSPESSYARGFSYIDTMLDLELPIQGRRPPSNPQP